MGTLLGHFIISIREIGSYPGRGTNYFSKALTVFTFKALLFFGGRYSGRINLYT